MLYGTSEYANDGFPGYGTVFAVDIFGGAFNTLHYFSSVLLLPGPGPSTNADGCNPRGGLILLGNILYGTAVYGGTGASGDVFDVNINDSSFTNLFSFTSLGFEDIGTNSTGGEPYAGLISSGNAFYGTATRGGSSASGTVFKLNPDGTGFTTLYNFARNSAAGPYLESYTNSDGAFPYGALTLSNNTFYGTTYEGGLPGSGTIFSLTFAPQVSITLSRTNAILTWPTNVAGFVYTGFTLQSATNLGAPAAWVTVSPPPVPINGQNTVTNPVTGTQKFYRLSR